MMIKSECLAQMPQARPGISDHYTGKLLGRDKSKETPALRLTCSLVQHRVFCTKRHVQLLNDIFQNQARSFEIRRFTLPEAQC